MDNFTEKDRYPRLSDENLIGLSFSGGGYRSALFSYGILKGLHQINCLRKFHYLSCVSGGSWMGMAFSIWKDIDEFFDDDYWEEEFTQSLFSNDSHTYRWNFLSNEFSDKLENVFLEPIKRINTEKKIETLISDDIYDFNNRPFLIVNATHLITPSKLMGEYKGNDINYPLLAPGCAGEVFEMTQFYVWSESLGICDPKEFQDYESLRKGLRPKTALAISGAAPHFSTEILDIHLMAREMENYNPAVYNKDKVVLTDGGQIENLGVKALLRRNCKKIFIVDSEYDEFDNDGIQNFSAMKKVFAEKKELVEDIERVFQDKQISMSRFKDGTLDILYLKLRQNDTLDSGFDPMIKTYDTNYNKDQFQHLKDLGINLVISNQTLINDFFNS